jgi:NAD+ synthase
MPLGMSQRISPDNFSLKEPRETVERIHRFLGDYLDKTHASVFVLGMSGGLDSSVAGALCAQAVGGKRVIGVHMPEEETRNKLALDDAQTVARKFRIRFQCMDITDLVKTTASTLASTYKSSNLVALGNIKARLRAILLYYVANVEHGIVVGTGDKSEIMLGYFTKYGDGACDLLPMADLYKTTVRHLAKYLAVPERVYSKPASPELWPGQTAKDELGLEYAQLDEILWGLERWMSSEEIAQQTGFPLSMVEKVKTRWMQSEHKRRAPLALKSGYRTPGTDMRLPF